MTLHPGEEMADSRSGVIECKSLMVIGAVKMEALSTGTILVWMPVVSRSKSEMEEPNDA